LILLYLFLLVFINQYKSMSYVKYDKEELIEFHFNVEKTCFSIQNWYDPQLHPIYGVSEK